MNLIEARKLGHEGWVRSPTRSANNWARVVCLIFVDSTGSSLGAIAELDLDAEDWEPRPKPVEPFEAEVWVLGGLVCSAVPIEMQPDGWRRIRVREVTNESD